MIVTPNRAQVLFHTEQIDLVSRLIEGAFPNFRQIIPKSTRHKPWSRPKSLPPT